VLRHITIRDFAIIDALEVDLGPGMTALTGETGAGKSILIDVIGLLLGDRGDAASVRDGATQADLCAEFELADRHPATAWIREQALEESAAPLTDGSADRLTDALGGDGSDGQAAIASGTDTATRSLLVRRVITTQGKSRAWINGRPVTMSQLKTLSQWLVDIHGQHAHQQFLQRPVQRELLDSFVAPAVRTQVTACHRALHAAEQHLAAARARQETAGDRIDLLRFQTAELEELAPNPGEYAQISAEQVLLAHASEVLMALQAAHEGIDDDTGLDPRTGQVLSGLQGAARHDARIEPILELLESARLQVQEASDQLHRLADRIEIDPQRLETVDARLGTYLRLARKHQVDPDALPDLLQQMSAELAELASGDAALEALEQALGSARAAYDQAAQALSRARRKAADKLAKAVTAAIQDLGMTGGHFGVDLQHQVDETGPYGQDRIEFMVAANPGSAAQPLARVASGGELSRIGLALQVLASAEQPVDTLIFDEVDSGISGAVAEVVGRQLSALGRRYQVLCVTHLPQVAAQAHQQLQVSKHRTAAHTHTRIAVLDPEARVEAIARMLGGVAMTPSSLAHAREMLDSAEG